MKESVISYIREHRKNLGMTQEELARQVGVSRQSIISIEQGKYVPSLPLALKFGQFFKCSTDELFELKQNDE